MITGDFKYQRKDVMKRKKTVDDMTLSEILNIFLYRPYDDDISLMVDDSERIHFRGAGWIVIIDHHTGEFYFRGELSRYYDIDTITSIRNAFGDIYTWFNPRFSSLERNKWIDIDMIIHTPDEEKEREKREISLLQHKKYYLAHKEEINRKQRERYWNKKKGLS